MPSLFFFTLIFFTLICFTLPPGGSTARLCEPSGRGAARERRE
jgi:hypothetical protein